MNCFSNKLIVLVFLLGPILSFAQVIDSKHIESQIENGNVDAAVDNLNHFLGPEMQISHEDSIYAFKTLGMISVVKGDIPKAKQFFKNLFLTDPAASIRNTDASYAIIEVFLEAKNEFKKEHGGEILRPKVIVMDPLGSAVPEQYSESIARQFIEELQRLWLFDAQSRAEIHEQFSKDRMDPKQCKDEACFINMAKNIEGDKLVLLYFEQVEQVYSLILKYIDVRSQKTETVLKKSAVNSLDSLILTGLQEMAIQLEKQNAAWLQFTTEPANAYLELNGEATDGGKKIPVMPGKHKICASATGFETQCRDIEVKPNDGITHRIGLKPEYSEEHAKANEAVVPKEENNAAPGASSFPVEVYILAGLAAFGLILVVLFNQ